MNTFSSSSLHFLPLRRRPHPLAPPAVRVAGVRPLPRLLQLLLKVFCHERQSVVIGAMPGAPVLFHRR